jgi:heme exporter protein A
MLLSGSDLECVRGGRRVFAKVGFALAAGEALLLVGPNGAGKSSLLRIVAGLLKPAGGTLALSGADPDRSLAEQAHYLGHLDAQKSSLSARENLEFWTRFLGGGRGKQPREALEAVGLGEVCELPAGYLSAGQRRRLSIARLLAVARPIWLLDEPTNVLDANGHTLLREVMRSHLAAGGLILAAGHGPVGLDAARELRLGAVP